MNNLQNILQSMKCANWLFSKKEYSNGPLRIEYTNKTELFKTKRLTYFSINISVSSQHQFFIKTKLRAVSVKL